MNKKLTLNENNASIIERMEETYLIWDTDVKKARDIIKKMYYKEFNKLTNIAEQRLILHNLVCSEIEAEECITNSAKLWAKELLNFLNNNPEYIKINLEDYSKALTAYLYTHEKDLNNNEKIQIYELYYETFKECEYIDGGKESDIRKYLDKMNAKFSLNLLKKNFDTLLEIFEEVLIHNDNLDCTRVLNYFLKDVQDINYELYNQMLLLLQNNYNLRKIC